MKPLAVLYFAYMRRPNCRFGLKCFKISFLVRGCLLVYSIQPPKSWNHLGKPHQHPKACCKQYVSGSLLLP